MPGRNRERNTLAGKTLGEITNIGKALGNGTKPNENNQSDQHRDDIGEKIKLMLRYCKIGFNSLEQFYLQERSHFETIGSFISD